MIVLLNASANPLVAELLAVEAVFWIWYLSHNR